MNYLGYMNTTSRTYNEQAFDKIFREKEHINYSKVTGKMGWRDKKVVKHLLEHGVKDKYCLDVGPGTGRWLQFLKDNGAAYLGAIDISRESLNRCSHLCNKVQKANVETDRFDFKDNFFDVVVSFMILEHLRDPGNYISEIIRVVKKGGLILMTIPNIASFLSRIRLLLGILPAAVSSDNTHVRFYTKRELITLFKPFDLIPEMIPTSFSINPFNSKRLKIPSNKLTCSLDDHLLFRIYIN